MCETRENGSPACKVEGDSNSYDSTCWDGECLSCKGGCNECQRCEQDSLGNSFCSPEPGNNGLICPVKIFGISFYGKCNDGKCNILGR